MKYLLLLLLTTPVFGATDCVQCPEPEMAGRPMKISEWPLELIKVEKEDYERNAHASFCKRPPEMVDTIVIHHSETPPTFTAQRINELHLNRGTKDDPWYMIGYTYVINSPYPGSSSPKPRVTEGRPFDIVGAHAGSSAFVSMDNEQKKLWNEGKVVCGREGEEFKVDSKLVQNGKIKANITTIGLVVNGNYSPFSRSNPNGYRTSKPRNPSNQTLDMIARMSCQIQKKHPRVKSIKWHNYYHATSCPGNLKNYINNIKNLAKRYGCEFN